MQFVINLNGQSRDAFVMQSLTLGQAVDKLREALQAASPHPRDYPGNLQGYQVDLAEYQRAVRAVRDVQHFNHTRAERIVNLE